MRIGQPFIKEINLTEARKNLSSILRDIEQHPEVEYQIKVRNRVVAEVRRPETHQINSGEAMLRAAKMAAKLWPRKPGEKPEVTSRNFKEYLYGDAGIRSSRRRSRRVR